MLTNVYIIFNLKSSNLKANITYLEGGHGKSCFSNLVFKG